MRKKKDHGSNGQVVDDIQKKVACGTAKLSGIVQAKCDTHRFSDDVAQIISEVKETHGRREDLLRAEVRLTLQIKAICRRLCAGDKEKAEELYKAMDETALGACLPLMEARDILSGKRKEPEKILKKLATSLPAYCWASAQRGFGDLSFGQIIAECGDLALYDNPAKLWKRMGMAVINGKSQRRVAGNGGIEQGYSPKRRSMMYVVGDCLIRAGGYYRDIYIARKLYESQKAPDISKMHAHRRAKRYMEKRLLRDLWREWRNAVVPMTHEKLAA